jgi:Na+/H+ antiporter NhaC
MEEKEAKEKKQKWIEKYKIGIIFSISILVVLVFWIVNYNIEMKKVGEFGDKFGAVNALFSGLAFAGIIITVYMQKEELSLQ